MTPAGQGEPGDSRADHGGFHEVVAAARRGRIVPLTYPQPDSPAGLPAAVWRRSPRPRRRSCLTSSSSWRLASCRDSLTSSVQPGHLGVARRPASLSGRRPVVVPRPDRDAEGGPGGCPARHDQLGESCPDRSQVNGSCTYAAPGARTAVPIAVNSRPPRENDPWDSRMPTTRGRRAVLRRGRRPRVITATNWKSAIAYFDTVIPVPWPRWPAGRARRRHCRAGIPQRAGRGLIPLLRVPARSGDVGAAGGGAPDQDAGFGLF